jgi:hypothetical protein
LIAISTIMLCYSLFHTIKTQAVSVPSNIEAQMIVLYKLSNATIPNQTFLLTFNLSNFSSIPSFGFGINNYVMGNSLQHVNFQSQSTNLTSKSVGILVATDNSTIITKFSISYISIWNFNSIFIVSLTMSNVSTKLFRCLI